MLLAEDRGTPRAASFLAPLELEISQLAKNEATTKAKYKDEPTLLLVLLARRSF